MSAPDRDLFRAIVLSGAALVATTPGCGQSSTANDAAATPDAGSDAAVMLADAGSDAATADDAALGDDANDDAFVVIL